jgi:hypothetical protein
MKWKEIRSTYPDQWLVVEAVTSFVDGGMLVPSELKVAARCADGGDAMDTYRRLNREHPERDFVFVHTSRETLALEVHSWVGIRPSHAT